MSNRVVARSTRRSTPLQSRGTLIVEWPFFGELCRALALRVARSGYQPEVVLGVAKAGVIPGVVVASILQCDFASMVVTRREQEADPVLVEGPPSSIRGRRVLIVDETCESGSTMRLALSEVRAQLPSEVQTAVSFKTGDYTPDFHAFETENFIILPWDREVIVNGEVVERPDYAARLG
jgi:hypoxanthine phosphoribosyltransferase